MLTTRDIGLSLRIHFERRAVIRFDEDGEQIREESACVDYMDLSDPDNPVVILDNGQQFTIRIFAGA